jgi:enoyl-CoA hydratase/carnithine racemase
MIDLSLHDRVAYITMKRAPVNSYNLSFIQELEEALKIIEDNPQIRVAIIQSGLSGFFSAGADIRVLLNSTKDTNIRMIQSAQRVFSRIADIPKIFVAQINGHALGGGLELALACDFRFAADGNYRIGLPEVTLGLLPGNGGTQRLPRLIGWVRALDLMLSGKLLSPTEAYHLGIVDRLFPADALASETLKFANSLARGAFKAVAAIKLAVRRGMDRPLAEGLALELNLVSALLDTEDAREGLNAFLEKRPPQFKGG